MTQPHLLSLRALAGACALLAAIGAAHAQTNQQSVSTDSNVPPAVAAKQAREIAQGDPARWFHENPSMGARLRNLQKEIGAALQEAQDACRKEPRAERAACNRDARATYQQDMAGARDQVMAEFKQ